MKSEIFTKKDVLIGLSAMMILVLLGTYIFSNSMETLDVKADELGVEEHTLLNVPFPDYAIPGIESNAVNLVLGITSTLLVFLVSYEAANLITKKQGNRGATC